MTEFYFILLENYHKEKKFKSDYKNSPEIKDILEYTKNILNEVYDLKSCLSEV